MRMYKYTVHACFYLCKGYVCKSMSAYMCLCVITPVCVCLLSARQVRNWGLDPALKDREERGWFCIHGNRESRSRKPTGSQGVQHAIGGSSVVMTL